ncbi:outer membrane surface antigen [Phyllobacterium sp. YR620]|uniref:RT0821/Lpp0805 family surface protein n=1 Tax=Phyllobacterium sp. YR620 TaxID=1881066 RepID=UPI0008899CCA|nr:outer membrane surface antigen [Phyllobacterium sp. YR620]
MFLAFPRSGSKQFRADKRRAGGLFKGPAIIVVFGLLQGCAMKGFSIEKAVPDQTAVTGSVAPAQAVDAKGSSDQTTVRNIVSALNFTQWGKKPVPWSNPETGSQGTITAIAEKKNETELCREFQTSRESFDGVMLYKGETCMQNGGQWTLKSFAPM